MRMAPDSCKTPRCNQTHPHAPFRVFYRFSFLILSFFKLGGFKRQVQQHCPDSCPCGSYWEPNYASDRILPVSATVLWALVWVYGYWVWAAILPLKVHPKWYHWQA